MKYTKLTALFCAMTLCAACAGCEKKMETKTLASYTAETGIPAHVIPAENGKFYALCNAYDSTEYAISFSDNAEAPNIIHDLPADAWTWYLDASEDGAIWCECGTSTYVWNCYNAADGSITEIDGDYQQNGFQNMKVGVYDGYAYYAHTDYSHQTAEIIRYSIAGGTSETVYTFSFFGEISIQSLKISENYLILAGCTDSQYPDAVVIDLKNDQTTVMEMGAEAAYVYDAAYDGKTLALYYENGATGEEQIGVYDKETRKVTPIMTFPENYYAYHDTINCVDGEIYWIEQQNVSGDIADHYSLNIHKISDGTSRNIPTAFDYEIAEDGLYYLCYAEGTQRIDLIREASK